MLKLLSRYKYGKLLGLILLSGLFFYNALYADALQGVKNVIDANASSYNVVYTSSIAYQNSLFNMFGSFDTVKLNASSNTNLENLISYFCLSVNLNGLLYQDGMVYSPHQSVFLYLLCSNIDSYYSGFFLRNNETYATYFRTSDFNKLGLSVGVKDKGLAHLYVHELFNNIISEYFNIKQAHVYGLETAKEENKKIEEQADRFTSAYFKGLAVCSNSDPYDFKETCSYLKQYLRKAKDLVNGLNILDMDKMYEDYMAIEKDAPAVCLANASLATADSYNMLLCGLWGMPGEKDLGGFINLVYNEYFYYNLFVEYYNYRQNKAPSQLSKTNVSDDLATIYGQQEQNIKIMNNNIFWVNKALDMSIKVLGESYVTFPIHVGMLMYRESIGKFGKEIAKIATPIYTLYDSLRNVQCAKK